MGSPSTPLSFDAQGNPIQNAPSATSTTAMSYDAQGNPISAPEGFWRRLGRAVGITPESSQQTYEHPLTSAIMADPGVSLVRGAISGAKRIGGELLQAGSEARQGNVAGTAVHAIQATPIIGAGLEQGVEQSDPTTGSFVGDVGKELTNPNVLKTVGQTALEAGGAIEGLRGAPEATAESKPGIIQQIRQGKNVAQEPAQQAIRQGVQAAGDSQGAGVSVQGPILQGNRTILDPTLEKLDALTSAEYSKLDQVAGFDVKAAERQLHEIQAELNQGVATSQNVTRRGNLIETANDLTDALNEADQKLQAAGIDPTVPRRMFQQQMAGNDLKKALIRATGPDGSVNVDQLLTASKNLRFTRWGDRLEQFFGSPQAANEFQSQLMKAQQMGVHSLKMQRLAMSIAKRLAIGAGIGAGAGLAYEAKKALE